MDQSECRNLYLGSLLHDIGKIGIPDGTLLKSGPLAAHEGKIMRTHTIIGEQILSAYESEVFEMAVTIARAHHDRWDGSGYPDGLKGEEVRLAARIV